MSMQPAKNVFTSAPSAPQINDRHRVDHDGPRARLQHAKKDLGNIKKALDQNPTSHKTLGKLGHDVQSARQELAKIREQLPRIKDPQKRAEVKTALDAEQCQVDHLEGKLHRLERNADHFDPGSTKSSGGGGGGSG